MDEKKLRDDQMYIEGTITEGELAGLTIRIGPVPRGYEFSGKGRCDTVFMTETCHPAQIQVRQGAHIAFAMLGPCNTINVSSDC